jgi:hypothetical protein
MRKMNLLLLQVVGVACLASGGFCAEPVAGEDKTSSVPQRLKFNARETRYIRKSKAVVLSGSAWVSAKGILIEAENIVVFPSKQQVWADGLVRMTEKDGRLICNEIYYDFKVDRGRATGVRMEIGSVKEVSSQAQSVSVAKQNKKMGSALFDVGGQAPNKWFCTAPEVRRAGPGRWVIIRPRISNCGFEKPHWSFQASSANYFPGRRIESFNNLIRLGDIPVFYLPYIGRDLAHDYPWTTWQFGDSDQWGPYVLSKWGVDLPYSKKWLLQPRNLFFDLDWRQDRGFAYGLDLRYSSRPQGGGLADTYFLRETDISQQEDAERAADDIDRRTDIYDDLRLHGAPKIRGNPKRLYPENQLFVTRRLLHGFDPADLTPQLYQEEDRYRLSLVHRQGFFRLYNPLQDKPVYKLDLTVEYHNFSDRDFQREYFNDEYRHGLSPISFAMLRNQSDVMSAAVLFQPRVDAFSDQVEYLPQLSFDIPDRHLPGGFYLASRGSIGRLYRRFDEDSGFKDFDAGRGNLQLMASRPFKLGPFAINPYVGMDQTWYSDNFEDGNVVRGALIYGGKSSVRFYGEYDLRSESLNIHALRHVIEPLVFFKGVSTPTHSSSELYDFDERDDLVKTNIGGAGLIQIFQVKRKDKLGGIKSVDLFGVSFLASGYCDRDEAEQYNDNDMLLPMQAHGFLRPTDWLQFWGRVNIDAHGVGLTGSTAGVRYTPVSRFSLTLSHTTVTEDKARAIAGSNYLSGRADLALGPLYTLSATARYEFDDPDVELGEQGLDSASLRLIRDMHCWKLGLGFSTKRDDDERKETFSLTLSPTGRPRNLVKGTDQLLIKEEDYSRPPWMPHPSEVPGAIRAVPAKSRDSESADQ